MPELTPNEILLSEDQIRTRVAEMALEIRRDFPGDLHVIAVLKGAFMFLSDLIRAMPGHVSLDFMAVSSYAKGTTSSGEVRMLKDLETALEGRNVVIVEDIVDTGLTLTYLLRVLAARGPASLRVCALLDKRARRIVDVPLSYVGFEVPDVFLVGYGLDLDERERGRGELLAVDDLEAVRDNPALLDLPTRPNDAWRPPRA